MLSLTRSKKFTADSIDGKGNALSTMKLTQDIMIVLHSLITVRLTGQLHSDSELSIPVR